jgi:hypothetical protein
VNISEIITEEMVNWFIERTNKHISLVQKYCQKIYNLDSNKYAKILDLGENHDANKFKEPELIPYIILNWYHYCNDHNMDFDYTQEMQNMVNKATEHHILNSLHHPEHWQDKKTGLINLDDRDSVNIPIDIIDGTNMPDLYIGEMVADWCAMAEERKENTPEGWAKKTLNIRWKFSNSQISLIYNLINSIWK